LVSCTDCAMRLRVFERRRNAVLHAPPVPAGLLARERSQILARIEQRPRFRLHWVPAAVLAGGMLAAVALVPHRIETSAEPDKVAKQEVAEEQWFREVFSMERAEEPRAASPIRGLFDEREQQ
jgi:hypothetical protein